MERVYARVERGFADELAAELASTLDWWAEAGVDSLVAEEPRDWLKPQILPGTGRGTSEAGGGVDSTNAAESTPPSRADARATSPFRGGSEPEEVLPDQLTLFHEWLRTSPTLPYAAPSAPRICPSGDPAAGLMILVAMPSAEDCEAGTLLSGAAGRLFDRMLIAIGRSRETIYLGGLSCVRPPAGRLDGQGAARCADLARHHIALAEPKAVLLLGDACAKALLGLGAAQARGRVHQIDAGGRSVAAIVTLSPDYLLTQPAAKAMAWADLQLLMDTL